VDADLDTLLIALYVELEDRIIPAVGTRRSGAGPSTGGHRTNAELVKSPERRAGPSPWITPDGVPDRSTAALMVTCCPSSSGATALTLPPRGHGDADRSRASVLIAATTAQTLWKAGTVIENMPWPDRPRPPCVMS
jgi:hypothetical protein